MALLLIAAVLGAISVGRAPRWLGVYAVAAGAVSATAYWYDKRQAMTGRWRISEMTLHSLDLLGGSIGGLLMQVAIRHKTAKPSFTVGTTMVLVAQTMALGAMVVS